MIDWLIHVSIVSEVFTFVRGVPSAGSSGFLDFNLQLVANSSNSTTAPDGDGAYNALFYAGGAIFFVIVIASLFCACKKDIHVEQDDALGYVVVEFLETGAVEAVPSPWVDEDQCAIPPKDHKNNLQVASKKRDQPHESWQVKAIKVVDVAADYKEANEKVKEFMQIHKYNEWRNSIIHHLEDEEEGLQEDVERAEHKEKKKDKEKHKEGKHKDPKKFDHISTLTAESPHDTSRRHSSKVKHKKDAKDAKEGKDPKKDKTAKKK